MKVFYGIMNEGKGSKTPGGKNAIAAEAEKRKRLKAEKKTLYKRGRKICTINMSLFFAASFIQLIAWMHILY